MQRNLVARDTRAFRTFLFDFQGARDSNDQTHVHGRTDMGSTFELVPLNSMPIAVVDLETTGLSSYSDRIVQVGVVHVQGPAALSVAMDSLINPQRPIDPRASKVHGITDCDVAKAPTFGDTAGRLVASLEGRVLAAYNASFDLAFLRAEFRRVGLSFKAPHICLMELRQMIFGARQCRLGEACNEMGVRLENAHDAKADARATAMLLQRYVEILRRRRVHTIGGLKEYGQRRFVSSFSNPGFCASTDPLVETARRAPSEGLDRLERDCERMTKEAAESLDRVARILCDGLKKNVRVRWEGLMMPLEFDEPPPAVPVMETPEKPDVILKPDPAERPSRDDSRYQIDESVLFSFIPWLKEKKLEQIEDRFRSDQEAYNKRVERWNQLVTDYRQAVEGAKQSHARQMASYHEEQKQYDARRKAYLDQAASFNAKVTGERMAYETGEPAAVARAMTRVLMNSELPGDFPDRVDVVQSKTTGHLCVIRELPGLDDLPSIKGYRVIKKDAVLKEQLLSDAARKRLFDGIVYQMALRTVFEIYAGDTAKRVGTVDLRCAINGYDPATGHPGRLVLAHVSVTRGQFAGLRLENVDPEVCFKSLGGKTNGRPANLKPIEVIPPY